MLTALSRPRVSLAVGGLLFAAVAALTPPALAQAGPTQAEEGRPAAVQPTVKRGRGFGLGGVRVTFPGTNTINSTPPLQRRGESLLPPAPTPSRRADRSPTRPIIVIPPPRRPIVIDPRFRRHDHDRDFGHGLTVDGSFKDDDSKLHIHIGSDPIRHLPRRRVFDDDVRFVWPHGTGYYDYYNRPRYPIDGTYGVVDAAMVPVAVQPADAPPPVDLASLTPFERAEFLMGVGEPEGAIAAYREHLEVNPDDAAAMRSLAVALLATKDPRVAAAVMALAYRTDPSLAERPIDGSVLPEGPRGLRTLVRRASVYANRTESASSWLSLAVLMQAEGREELALRMIGRASEAGLDPALAERFRAVLGGRPGAGPAVR